MRLLSYFNFIGSCVFKQIALLFLCIGVAHAHNLPSGMGTINANKDKAFVVLSLPVSLFKSADDNADGKLSQTELQRHQVAIRDTIQQGFSFYNISAKNNTATNHIDTNTTAKSNNTQNLKDTNTSQPQQMKTVAVSLIDDSPNHSHSHNHHSNSHQGHNHGEHEHTKGVNASATINYLGVVNFATPINKLRVTSDLFSKASANYKFELYAKRAGQPKGTSSQPKREKMLFSAIQQDVIFFGNSAFITNELASRISSDLVQTEQFIWFLLLLLLGLIIIFIVFIMRPDYHTDCLYLKNITKT